jgi:plasmid stabilization system protein ParE
MEQRPHGIIRADTPHQVVTDQREARRILLGLSPSELLLILTAHSHMFKSDVEEYIRQGLLADPRLEPLQLEQLESGVVVLPDGRHLLTDGQIIIPSPVNDVAEVSPQDSEPGIASESELTHKQPRFSEWRRQIDMARRAIKLKKAAKAIRKNPGVSTRVLAERTGLSQSTISRALKVANDPPANGRHQSETAEPVRKQLADLALVEHSHPARKILSATVAAAAFGLSITALGSNISWTAGMGQTFLGAGLLAGLGLAIDVLQTVMPLVANELGRRRHMLSCVASWGIWAGCALWTTLAILSYSGSQIGDGIASREKITDATAATKIHLDQARAARASISELRTAAAINIEMQSFWAAIPKNIRKSTADCSNVTLPSSLELCAPILKLKMAADAAAQRDELDRQIRSDEASLAAVPAIGSSDAGASNAAAFLREFFEVSPGTVQRVRVGLLSIMPIFAGLLFLYSSKLWREKLR